MNGYSSLSIEELVRVCSSAGEAAAWEEFVRRLHRLIAKVVLRTAERLGDGSRQTVDDLIQNTYLKFCANDFRILRDFENRHDGSFLGFVQVIAVNVVRDHFRSPYEKNRSASRMSDAAQDRTFAMAAVEESRGGSQSMEREILMQEVDRVLEQCTRGPDQKRNMKVFWLYYKIGLSAGAIAVVPGIRLQTKGVESLILRMTRDVRERMAEGKRGQIASPRGTGEGIRPAESF